MVSGDGLPQAPAQRAGDAGASRANAAGCRRVDGAAVHTRAVSAGQKRHAVRSAAGLDGRHRSAPSWGLCWLRPEGPCLPSRLDLVYTTQRRRGIAMEAKHGSQNAPYMGGAFSGFTLSW